MYRRDEMPWDHGEACPGLVQWLKQNRLSGRVIVPGCGRGHDVRAIANACPEAEVIGLDISPRAVELAQAMNNPDNASFMYGDLFDPNSHPLNGTADWIWEHTCFCAIPISQRKNYVRSVRGLLKGSGSGILAIFYLNPEMDDDREGPPFGCTLDELDQLFTPEFRVWETFEPPAAYESRIGREKMRLMKAV